MYGGSKNKERENNSLWQLTPSRRPHALNKVPCRAWIPPPPPPHLWLSMLVAVIASLNAAAGCSARSGWPSMYAGTCRLHNQGDLHV
jgi:hypothetical protein